MDFFFLLERLHIRISNWVVRWEDFDVLKFFFQQIVFLDIFQRKFLNIQVLSFRKALHIRMSIWVGI